MICEKCPAEKPYYYENTQDCHEVPEISPTPVCHDGYHLDELTNMCV